MRAFERLIRDFDRANAKRERKKLGAGNFQAAAACYALALASGAVTAFTDDPMMGAGLGFAALGAGFLDLGFVEREWGPGGSRVGDPL